MLQRVYCGGLFPTWTRLPVYSLIGNDQNFSLILTPQNTLSAQLYIYIYIYVYIYSQWLREIKNLHMLCKMKYMKPSLKYIVSQTFLFKESLLHVLSVCDCPADSVTSKRRRPLHRALFLLASCCRVAFKGQCSRLIYWGWDKKAAIFFGRDFQKHFLQWKYMNYD